MHYRFCVRHRCRWARSARFATGQLIKVAVLSEQLAKGSGALRHAREAARILIQAANR